MKYIAKEITDTEIRYTYPAPNKRVQTYKVFNAMKEVPTCIRAYGSYDKERKTYTYTYCLAK